MFVNKGENVRLASRVIILVCERLADLRALPYDAMKTILTFFVKASDPDFVKFVERKRLAMLDIEVDQPDFGLGTSQEVIMRGMLAGQEKTVENIRALCEVLSRFYERKTLSNTEKWICAQPSTRKNGSAFNAVNFVPVCDNCGTKLGKSEGECRGPKKCKFKEFNAARVKRNMQA